MGPRVPLAIYFLFLSLRLRPQAVPFAMTVLFFVAAFLTLAVMFWPYMIPYEITVGNAAAPEASLSFLFWGRPLLCCRSSASIQGSFTGCSAARSPRLEGETSGLPRRPAKYSCKEG